VVAIPAGCPTRSRDLARLVLSQSEYDELVRVLAADPGSFFTS